ncbi:phosphate/phosphite/phosphonate ABC transporter substrate-binding protein [Paenibacillus periandrae]|uniref:phosphate/phosphite/phosphonate ABC transporter substrate-binding protein n=1 Tax=Paenibacillus periandrae TaxID=1761741 RepID=UPI001F09BFAD|nr:phosphate/phosphite/phosphonate ABC transporter substrate-binding protein [Paenibacillus periandrae]
MKNRNLLFCILCLMVGTTVLFSQSRAMANDSVKARITLDNTELALEVPPINHQGTVMVPMRPIFEALGASLIWNENQLTVIAERGNTTISLKVGSSFAYINDRAVVLGAVPFVNGGNTLVPVRFIAEAFNATVVWTQADQLAAITTESTRPTEGEIIHSDSGNYVPASLNIRFVPSQSAEILLAKAKPLEKLLSDQLAIPVKLSIDTNYNSVHEALKSKTIDISFLPPSGYVLAHDKHHSADILLQALKFGIDAETGRSTSKLTDFYQSMFIVKADSSICTLEDLKGKKIGWQAETSAAGYVYPADLLKSKGIDPKQDIQGSVFKGHDKSIIAVLNGQVDAAAVFQDARNIVKIDYPDVMSTTRVLAMTDKLPNDTVVVRPDMTPEWKHKIQDAFISLGQDPLGKKIIYDVFSHNGYTVSEDSKFDIVRNSILY